MKDRVRYIVAATLYIIIFKAYKYAEANPFRVNEWYFLLSFSAFAFIILLSAYELIEKNIAHKKQGDKLKIKAQNWSKGDGSA